MTATPFRLILPEAGAQLSSPVFGVLDSRSELFFGDEQARAAYDCGKDRLRALGHQTKVIDFAPFKALSDMTYFGPSMAERTAVLGEFIENHPEATYMPVVRDAIANASKFTAVDVFSMLHSVRTLARTIEREAWSQVNVLCVPTSPTIHTREFVRENPALGSTSLGDYTNFAPFLGLPAFSVPNGFRSDGLPTGIMFVGKRLDDVKLLQIGEMFQH